MRIICLYSVVGLTLYDRLRSSVIQGSTLIPLNQGEPFQVVQGALRDACCLAPAKAHLGMSHLMETLGFT